MPRRERDRELARRRQRAEKRRKLRAKGLLPPVVPTVKSAEKRRPEKPAPKEAGPAAVKEGTEPSTPQS